MLDVSEVDLRAAHDNSDQCLIVGAETLHRVVQTLSEEAHFALDALNCKEKILSMIKIDKEKKYKYIFLKSRALLQRCERKSIQLGLISRNVLFMSFSP